MADRDFAGIDARFRERFDADRERIDSLLASLIPTVAKNDLTILAQVAEKGLASVLRRRAKSAENVELLVNAFIEDGPVAVLRPGPQRGGDFLNNQLRGRWAENVAASMPLPNTVIIPFGPSGAAMPGEEDHRKITTAFAQIHLLEGKRPDLLAFERSAWESFDAVESERATMLPKRLLERDDEPLVRAARFAMEVKNSTWHYGKRRDAGGGSLSITVKEEELAALTAWAENTGVPVLFVQVFFDEIYSMSYARMIEGKDRGYVYVEGDHKLDHERKSGKDVHKFFVDGPPHLCGRVEFPDESRAHVRILEDGSVVPYIEFAPARATDVVVEVFEREIAYAR